jgi:nucleoside-diphosphate-sugar epimerase
MSRLLIAGCGYVGLALSRAVSREGWTVWGLRRDPGSIRQLEEAGARPLIADLTQPVTLAALPAAEYVVAAHAPGRRTERYRATYLEGTQHLLAALTRQPPKRFVGISSTRVYGQTQGEWVDETSPTQPFDEEGRVLLEMESAILAAPFPSIVLRLAGIYGPGRDPLRRVREGRVSARDPGYLNHIHVEDVVGIICLLLERGAPREIYLGVDEEPVVRAQLYAWMAQRTGEPLPEPGPGPSGRTIGNKRCRNATLKALGYVWRYPTYREGLPTLMTTGASDVRS